MSEAEKAAADDGATCDGSSGQQCKPMRPVAKAQLRELRAAARARELRAADGARKRKQGMQLLDDINREMDQDLEQGWKKLDELKNHVIGELKKEWEQVEKEENVELRCLKKLKILEQEENHHARLEEERQNRMKQYKEEYFKRMEKERQNRMDQPEEPVAVGAVGAAGAVGAVEEVGGVGAVGGVGGVGTVGAAGGVRAVAEPEEEQVAKQPKLTTVEWFKPAANLATISVPHHDSWDIEDLNEGEVLMGQFEVEEEGEVREDDAKWKIDLTWDSNEVPEEPAAKLKEAALQDTKKLPPVPDYYDDGEGACSVAGSSGSSGSSKLEEQPKMGATELWRTRLAAIAKNIPQRCPSVCDKNGLQTKAPPEAPPQLMRAYPKSGRKILPPSRRGLPE